MHDARAGRRALAAALHAALAHPPERVWRSLTEPGRLAASFPGRLIGDLTIVGAPLRCERLEQALGGDTAPVAVAARWRQVHPDYIERFGPEGSTLGPPQPGFSAAG